MRRISQTFGFAPVALLMLASAAGAEESLEQVIEKHVAARGGRAAWKAVESISVTGRHTSFSMVEPYTLERKRPYRYHLSTVQNGRKVVIGFDGKTAWWENAWSTGSAEVLDGANLAVVLGDVDFATPLFDWAERGYTAKLLGATEYEGEPAIGIELTRPNEGGVEKWYLHPQTYLELVRESPGSDFGSPMEQRTVYDDFRAVGGLKVPFLTEAQWYTRDRIFKIEKIEIGAPIEDALFTMPSPPGMGPFQGLVGKWKVAVESVEQPGAEAKTSERTSETVALLRGALLQESFEDGDNRSVVRSLSYDQHRALYRLTEIDDKSTYLDLLQGKFDAEAGRLTVDNLETGTPLLIFGMTIHSRTAVHGITADGFVIEQEATLDGGKTWWVAVKSSYARAAE